MSFEEGQFLGSLFGADEAVSLAVADPPQPDASAPGDIIFVSYLKYSDDIANEDDLPGTVGDFDVVVDTVDLWLDGNAVDLPPCESCEGLELWETMLGEWKCSQCNPLETAQRLLDKAERLRKRYGLPDPLGAL